MIERREGGTYICVHCGKIMADKSKIKRHAEIHLNMSHGCIVCQKVFKTRNVLATHYTREHPNQVVSPWTMKWILFSKPPYVVQISDNKYFRSQCCDRDHGRKKSWREIWMCHLWQDVWNQTKSSDSCRGSHGSRSSLHYLSEDVQDQKFTGHSLHQDSWW